MNDTPIVVGAIYKLKAEYDRSFFQYDHGEKYIMVLDEDYSDLHPMIKVLIYHKKEIGNVSISLWSIKSFDRWEMISEAR